MKPDFGATATDYAAHRAGFPDSLFDRLAKLGLGGALCALLIAAAA